MIMSSPWTSLPSIVAGIAVCLVAIWWRLRRARLPPGPRAWPLIGCLPTLVSYFGTYRPHELFNHLSKKYGPIVNVELLAGKRAVILHGHDVIRDAFTHPGLSGRPSLPIFEHVLNGGVGVVGASGESATLQRKLILNFIRELGKPLFEEKISSECRRMADEIRTYDERAFDPSDILLKACFNAMASVILGERYRYDDPRITELVRVFCRTTDLMGGATGVVLFTPHSYLLRRFVPAVRECLDNMQYIRNITAESHEEHRKGYDRSRIRDFMDVIIRETGRDGASSTTIWDLYGSTADLFSAGSETAATTLLWGVLYMMAYPEIQERVRRELDAVVGRKRLPSVSDRARLPYTEAVLLELQRIASILPLGVPHRATQDVSFRGYVIPKGSVVFANLWAHANDPKLWPEPQVFRPERFLDEGTGAVLKPAELIPFGSGRRQCLGQQLAKIKLFIFFSHLLHQFTITKPSDAPPTSFDSQGGISLAPVPYKICAVPRR